MCHKLGFKCPYQPDVMHYNDPRFLPDGQWHEGKTCSIHDRQTHDKSYWVVSDYEEVFDTEQEAIEFDFDRNPEYHGCKEWSYNRQEDAICESDYKDLTEDQKEYVLYKECLWC
jgi:hypothetical protein